jgi:hypothetical protein
MMGSRYFSLYAPAKLRIELPSQAPDLGNLASKVPSPLQLIRSWQSLPPTHPHRSFRPKQVDAFSSISLLSTLNPFTGEGRNCRPAQRRNLSSIYRAASVSAFVYKLRRRVPELINHLTSAILSPKHRNLSFRPERADAFSSFAQRSSACAAEKSLFDLSRSPASVSAQHRFNDVARRRRDDFAGINPSEEKQHNRKRKPAEPNRLCRSIFRLEGITDGGRRGHDRASDRGRDSDRGPSHGDVRIARGLRSSNRDSIVRLHSADLSMLPRNTEDGSSTLHASDNAGRLDTSNHPPSNSPAQEPRGAHAPPAAAVGRRSQCQRPPARLPCARRQATWPPETLFLAVF